MMTGCTLAEADEVRRAHGLPGGPGRGPGVVLPRGAGRAATPSPTVERVWEVLRGVRLVRVLQGPRRGVRAADLPVGLAEGPPPGGVPGRGAHPRPGHVPQAADPRRRPQPRHRRPRPGRQRLRRRPTGSSRSRPATSRRPRSSAARPRAPVPGLPDGRAYGIRLSLADVKGITDGRGGADRRRPALRTPCPTSGTAPGCPGRWWSGWSLAGGFDAVYGIGRRPAGAGGAAR